MPRTFNTAGPCLPELHYMLPPERRLPEVRRLIDQQLYFVIHAPRQVGKTTCFRTLAETLRREGRLTALYASCEAGQTAGDDVEAGISAVLDSVRTNAEGQLPEEQRPPRPDAERPPETRLWVLLGQWCDRSPLPVVLFLDEIDALIDDTLISVLRQLRSGYPDRPDRFPGSVALIGLRDVRDYKVQVRPEPASLGTASPFNIKAESLTIRNFTRDEVAELYGQHTSDTGQIFRDEAVDHAFVLTRGQPWLVNALARQIVEKDVTDRRSEITALHVEAAKEALIERRDTHLDSLIDRLREPRVRRVIGPLLAGDLVVGDRIDDDVAYAEDLGLIERKQGGPIAIANPIYHEIIPRALAAISQMTIPVQPAWYVKDDGRLDMDALLKGFADFWIEHGEALLASQPYPEAAPQLILMAFLQRVVNGGGTIDREYALGTGRMDLCVRWPSVPGGQKEASSARGKQSAAHSPCDILRTKQLAPDVAGQPRSEAVRSHPKSLAVMKPEEEARKKIDAALTAAGWTLQDRNEVNLYAAQGVAVREFPLTTGHADYLLFVDGKAAGVVEAKKEGTTLTGVEPQTRKYSEGFRATSVRPGTRCRSSTAATAAKRTSPTSSNPSREAGCSSTATSTGRRRIVRKGGRLRRA